MEKQLKLEILERGKFDEKKQHLKKENVITFSFTCIFWVVITNVIRIVIITSFPRFTTCMSGKVSQPANQTFQHLSW